MTLYDTVTAASSIECYTLYQAVPLLSGKNTYNLQCIRILCNTYITLQYRRIRNTA